MEGTFKKVIAFVLSLVMAFSTCVTSFAAEDDSELAAGTYTVSVSASDYVSAMAVEFGGVVEDTAAVVVAEDGTVTMTLTFTDILIFSVYTGWVSEYYDDTAEIVYGTITAQDGNEYKSVENVTITLSEIADTYALSYYLQSTVMSFTRSVELSVDWSTLTEIEGDAGENAEDDTDDYTETEHTHSYSAVVTTEAACTTDGVITYTCSVCGDSYTETIAAVGHSYETVITEPTCTEDGVIIYTCSVCGDSYTETIAATGHSYTSEVTKAATCTAAGVRTYTCSKCGDTYTETIAKISHSYSGNVCTVCGTLKSSKISDAAITLSSTSYTYNGTARKPSVTVKINGTVLTKGTDYTVTYSNNTSIGTASVKITGKGSYSGSISKTFTIKPGTVKISSAASSAAKKLTVKWSKASGSVTGYQVRYKKSTSSSWTTVTVQASTLSKTLSSLTAGKKYNVQVRAYKTVSGTKYYGSWSSTKTVTVKKAQTLSVKSSSSKTVSYSKVKKAKQTVTAITKVSGAKGTVTYIKSSGKSYFTVNKSTGKITVKKGTPKGTYTVKIKVTSAAASTYASASKTVTVKIKVK